MLMFDLDAQAFGRALSADLDLDISPHEHRVFDDGECKLRPLVDPRGEDVYVIHGLYGDARHSPHDKLFALAMFVGALRDHGARRITAVVPYMAYGRKDRRTKPFDPVGSRYVAQVLEGSGISQLIVLEAHNPAALENAFRLPTLHLDAHPAFDRVAESVQDGPVVVVSPDPGGVKRAQLWRERLETRLGRPVGFAMVDKRRSGGVLSGGELVAGDVEGAEVLLLDDLIATGHTLLNAAYALRGAGARRVVACAAHGLFVEAADHTLGDPALDKIVVCDSVPPFRVGEGSPLRPRLEFASCVPLFGRALRESHAGWQG